FTTAATNGDTVYWCPRFLDSLSIPQALAIEKHEGWHIGLFHTIYMQGVEYPMAFNIAADFIVNSLVEREWLDFTNNHHVDNKNILWQAPLGEPITLSELKEVFQQDKQDIINNLQGVIDKVKKQNSNSSPTADDGCKHVEGE